jgi:hypothetical protein
MALSALEAHSICAGLVAVDVAARTTRLKCLLGRQGHVVSWRRALAINLGADGAAALTPYRAGGDVARIIGLRRAGIPPSQAAAVILNEAVQTWPVVLGGGAILTWLYGGAWWASFASDLVGVARRSWWALGVMAVLLALSVWLGPRLRRRLGRLGAGPAATRPPASPRWGRRLPFSLALTAVAVSARVLLLPVLAATLATAPPFGQSLFGSFALLHSQLVLPTPAGAGAVEIGFLAQMRDSVSAGRLLVLWRLYTSGIGIALGIAVSVGAGARTFARHGRPRAVERRAPSTLVP